MDTKRQSLKKHYGVEPFANDDIVEWEREAYKQAFIQHKKSQWMRAFRCDPLLHSHHSHDIEYKIQEREDLLQATEHFFVTINYENFSDWEEYFPFFQNLRGLLDGIPWIQSFEFYAEQAETGRWHCHGVLYKNPECAKRFPSDVIRELTRKFNKKSSLFKVTSNYINVQRLFSDQALDYAKKSQSFASHPERMLISRVGPSRPDVGDKVKYSKNKKI